MKITIRPTTINDVPILFGIRTHPQVVPHQYPLLDGDAPEIWAERIKVWSKTGQDHEQCQTILADDVVVGHVSHMRRMMNGFQDCMCGWNLHPEYWGRGIMCEALCQLFDRLMMHENVDRIFADCFRDNRRCRRVLAKLGFLGQEISLWDRFWNARQSHCWRWVVRYRLDQAIWRKRRGGIGEP